MNSNNYKPQALNSYLITNNELDWYISVNGKQEIGPIDSYEKAEKQARILLTLERELKEQTNHLKVVIARFPLGSIS